MSTHNSYRWSITEQLKCGVRGFELDIHDFEVVTELSGSWDKYWSRISRFKKKLPKFYFKIGHAWPGHEVNNKRSSGNPRGKDSFNFERWLGIIADWSKEHEDHAPITIFLDIKKDLNNEDNDPPEEFGLIRFNDQILKAIGRERLFTPRDFEKKSNPTIKDLKNKIIVVLMSFHTTSRKIKEEMRKVKNPHIIRKIILKIIWLWKDLPDHIIIDPRGAFETRLVYQKGKFENNTPIDPICFVAFNPEDRTEPNFDNSLEKKALFVTAYDGKYSTYQKAGKLVRTDYKLLDEGEVTKIAKVIRFINKILGRRQDRWWPEPFPDSVNFPVTDDWKNERDDPYHKQTENWVIDKWMKYLFR